MPKKTGEYDEDLRAIERILKFLIKSSKKCWWLDKSQFKVKWNEKAKDNFDYMVTRIPPTKPEELDDLIQHEPHDKRKLEVKNLYLPPLPAFDKEFVPILQLEADFSQSAKAKLDLRVALVTLNDQMKLCIFGYRFEMPHRNTDHDFYHGQFTRVPITIKNMESLCEMVAEWTPQHIPCVITPARRPTDHLICMLIGLYGKQAQDLVTDVGAEHKKVLQYLPRS